MSEAQTRYLHDLRASAGLPAELALNERLLEGPPDAIEALRKSLAELLAKRGFAADYSTNAEGELIEDLIDALFLKL